MSQQQDHDDGLTFRQQFNLAAAFVHLWAMSLQVFLHEKLGRRYPGPAGMFVVPLVLIYCLGWQGHSLAPMMLFLLLYVLLCLAHRTDALSRPKSAGGHSRYTGRPLLMNVFPNVPEVTIKCWLEPFCVVIAGMALTWLSAPLGWYVTLGGICMRLSSSLSLMIQDHQAMDLNDATIEQEIVVERFREMRDED